MERGGLVNARSRGIEISRARSVVRASKPIPSGGFREGRDRQCAWRAGAGSVLRSRIFYVAAGKDVPEGGERGCQSCRDAGSLRQCGGRRCHDRIAQRTCGRVSEKNRRKTRVRGPRSAESGIGRGSGGEARRARRQRDRLPFLRSIHAGSRFGGIDGLNPENEKNYWSKDSQ